MSRASLGTPCPAPTRSTTFPKELYALDQSGLEDDTAQVDYTRVIQQEFKQARPRRPGNRAARNVPPPVFEDVVEGEELAFEQRSRENVGRGLLLGKPAQRRVPRVDTGNSAFEGPQPLHSIGQCRTRPASIRDSAPKQTAQMQNDGEAPGKKDPLAKEPRRRTIFVPSDDTTIMTIHPGANTTNRLDDTFQLPAMQSKPLLECVLDQPSGETYNKPQRRPRMSMAAAPKRAPLQQMQVKSNNLPAMDVPGQNGGKENVPPGRRSLEVKQIKGLSIKSSEPSKAASPQSRLLQSTAASQARQSIAARNAVPIAKRGSSPTSVPAANPVKKRATATTKPSRPIDRTSAAERRTEPSPQAGRSPAQLPPWKAGSNFVAFTDVAKAKVQRYPVLSEDVGKPQLYEDNWLSQQEVALTEVANQIFANAEPSPFEVAGDKSTRRNRLITFYHQPHVAALHKRLQASLVYGALSQPKDMLSAPDLTRDLGLRRRFLHLWLDTYHLDALSAAAEIVVGRSMSTPTFSPQHGKASSPVSLDTKQSRRNLIGFLETFFVTVEDAFEDDQGQRHVDVNMQRRNKRILRSLILIWLLDKTASPNKRPCLFKTSSAHKTSASVLNAFTSMLIPSIGDVGRALRHFDYTLSRAQDPLDEVVYRIDNLAVDLRDGVFLNRLTEILLYSDAPATKHKEHSQGDETVTIVLPDATVLQSDLLDEAGAAQPRILSQHLKMPAIGRAQKIYNVDIALSALSAHCQENGMPTWSYTAEAIVDGHRENTINLLWSLVSTVGLGLLIDRQALVSDISSIDASASPSDDSTIEDLLQAWAAVYCLPKGVKITNLSTSFANGKAYAAIVESFAKFFNNPTTHFSSTNNINNTTTASLLRSMGCSEAFTRQLTPSRSTIPSRETTISNMAFLASRLLPLAKHHHAALAIQRAFRRRQAWRTLHQRVVLMKLASGCAEVVQQQQRVTTAATTLQRAWRRVVGDRIACLEADVGVFQALARGWKARRAVVKARKGRTAGYMGTTLGGW